MIKNIRNLYLFAHVQMPTPGSIPALRVLPAETQVDGLPHAKVVLGSWFLALGFWFLALGSWLLAAIIGVRHATAWACLRAWSDPPAHVLTCSAAVLAGVAN